MNKQTTTMKPFCLNCGYPIYKRTFEDFFRCEGCTWTGQIKKEEDSASMKSNNRHIDPETYKEIHTAMEDLFLGNYKLAYDRLYKTMHIKEFLKIKH